MSESIRKRERKAKRVLYIRRLSSASLVLRKKKERKENEGREGGEKRSGSDIDSNELMKEIKTACFGKLILEVYFYIFTSMYVAYVGRARGTE